MSKIKIGLIQVEQRPEDGYKERTEKLLSLAEQCYQAGADITFFPEAYQHVPDRGIIYRHEELKVLNAEWKERCAALAKKYGAYLVPWDYELCGDRVYNSSYILDRSGNEVGRYRKVQLTATEQARGIANGEGFPIFDLDFGKVGIMICWDNYFPESARCLAINGAQLVLYPLYGDTLVPGWEIKLRARAIDNGVYIASSQIDGVYDGAFTGLVAPSGEVIEKTWGKEGISVVTADVGAPVITHTTGNESVSEDIRRYTFFCRRPSAYGDLLRENAPDDINDIFFGKAPKK